ncbi:hypothetical protein [Metabacillus sp. RGM 3146]|uniref:hypothetical protein n=1 Tax=Metabacillus sp. RGM 3146 TaxID=3401092 RepID=UPI003B9AE097
MHFITGGAYNGKSKWVREAYGVAKNDQAWISAYRGDSLKKTFQTVTVIEGVEHYINESVKIHGEHAKKHWKEKLDEWMKWEQAEEHRHLVLIGCDISKGLVPMEQGNRLWRDVTGWIYQDIVLLSECTDVIWYGIAERLKGE